VAGVAALAWSVAPDASYQDIRDAIFAGVDKDDSFRLDGPTPVATGGRLNALGTLQRLKPFVAATTPAPGFVVTTPTTSFVISFLMPINPATVQAANLTVNGIPATAVTVSSDHTTATFTFKTSPVTVQGSQTIRLAGGTIYREGNATAPLTEYT